MSTPAHTAPEPEQTSILIVTAIDNIEPVAAALASALHRRVEIAATRVAALRLLDRRQYAVVVLDQILADSDPEGADRLWRYAGLAVPLQISFALAGTDRLLREIRAALARRQREQQLAAAAASAALELELRNSITALLLESRLALSHPELPPAAAGRLSAIATIAGRLRERFAPSVRDDSTSVPLSAAPK